MKGSYKNLTLIYYFRSIRKAFSKYVSQGLCTVVLKRFSMTPQFLVQEHGLVGLPVAAEAGLGREAGVGAQAFKGWVHRLRVTQISQTFASHRDNIFLLLFPF